MSVEFKLMFVYHGCMMILFMTGENFSTRQEILFAGALLLVLSSISIQHRRSRGWHWRGANPKNRLAAFSSLAVTAILLYAGTPLFSPRNPKFLPWYLAGIGIGLFNVLQSLRLVHGSEAAFLADCGEPLTQVEEPTSAEPAIPHWRKVLKTGFGVFFFLVWLEFLVFFYYSGKTFRDGSPVATATQTEPVSEHGRTVYITRQQKALWDRLELTGFIGIPSALVSGFILHFLAGVKVFDKKAD